MSSTGRVSERIALDQYWTPRWCSHRLLEAYELEGGLWLEPCAGTGAIIDAVREVRQDVTWQVNEIDPLHIRPLCQRDNVLMATQGDASALVIQSKVTTIITNPPFESSLEILIAMLRASDALTIFLQRLNWAAGPRREIFRALKPSVYVLPDRPSFMDMYEEATPEDLKAQTDSIEYAWFVFDGCGEFRVLADTAAEVRRAEIEEARANGTRPKKMSKPKTKREKVAA